MEYRRLGKTGHRVSALRWVLMADEAMAAIPGATTPDQARTNAAAAHLAPLPAAPMEPIRELYERRAMPLVHQRWQRA